jgi:hypothetical protein
MSRWWRWYLPGYVATLPLTVTALAYAWWRGAHGWRWIDGLPTFISSRLLGNPGGQTWSHLVGFASVEARDHVPLRVHEYAHVAQAMIFQVAGLVAWLAWLVLHLLILAGFRNRVSVLLSWIWNYVRRDHSARLILDQREAATDETARGPIARSWAA